MSLTVFVVPADGTAPFAAPVSKSSSLRGLQQLVGGNIETAEKAPKYSIFCNEEGRMEGLPVNPHAPAHCGPLVLVRNAPKGGTGSLTAEEATLAVFKKVAGLA